MWVDGRDEAGGCFGAVVAASCGSLLVGIALVPAVGDVLLLEAADMQDVNWDGPCCVIYAGLESKIMTQHNRGYKILPDFAA